MIIFNSNENWHGGWGPFSFPLSHLLKVGGGFETTCGQLTRTALGSTVALEGKARGMLYVLLCYLGFPAWPQ